MPTDDRESFSVKSGETASIVLYAGEAARANWTGHATFLGQDVDTLQLACEATGTRDRYGAYGGEEGGACASRLPPRLYAVRLLNLPELQFKLNPGEKRSDSFEIPARHVVISADEALCALLEPDEDGIAFALSAKPSWALLHMAGLDTLPAQECLFNFADRLREPDAEADANHLWKYTIPPGVYEWTLRSGTRNITGILDLRERGDANIALSLPNLPGMGLLEVHCRGYGAAKLPEVDFPDTLPDYGNTLRSEMNQEIFSTASRTFYDKQRDTWLVIAPVGHALLCVTEKEFTYYRQVSVPGVLTLTPMECCTLRITNDDSRRSLSGVATCNGMIVPIDAMTSNYASVNYLPPGTWLLNLRGELTNDQGEAVRSFADTWLSVSGDVELSASRFPWRQCGEASLRLDAKQAYLISGRDHLLSAEALDLGALGVSLSLGSDRPSGEGNSSVWTFRGLPEGHYRIAFPTREGSKNCDFYVEAGQKLELKP